MLGEIPEITINSFFYWCFYAFIACFNAFHSSFLLHQFISSLLWISRGFLLTFAVGSFADLQFASITIYLFALFAVFAVCADDIETSKH